MKEIHKAIAIVIQDNAFLMVRKTGKDIWTNLGGHVEAGETEEEAVLREIKEEVGCDAKVARFLGDFSAPAAFDDAIVKLSAFLVEINGEMNICDDELEEYRFIPENYRELGLKMPQSIEKLIIPFLKNEGLLRWKNENCC